MTRLIDADVLRESLGITGEGTSCKGCKYFSGSFYCTMDTESPSFNVVCEAIDDAPTVDAIPEKWILQEIENPSRSDQYRNMLEEMYYRWKRMAREGRRWQ